MEGELLPDGETVRALDGTESKCPTCYYRGASALAEQAVCHRCCQEAHNKGLVWARWSPRLAPKEKR
jgi:hypothetical protein